MVFFELQSGLRLALWPRRSLAHDTGLARVEPRIVRHAADTPWGGYAGYFQDPDAHLWEVVWNPQWAPDETGA